MRRQKVTEIERVLMKGDLLEAKAYAGKHGEAVSDFHRGLLYIGTMQYDKSINLAKQEAVSSMEKMILRAGVHVGRKQFHEAITLLKPYYEDKEMSSASTLQCYFLHKYLYGAFQGIQAPYGDLLLLSERLYHLSGYSKDHARYIECLLKDGQMRQGEKELRRMVLKHPDAPEVQVLKQKVKQMKMRMDPDKEPSYKQAKKRFTVTEKRSTELTPEESMATLESFVGLQEVKISVTQLIKEAAFNQERQHLLGIEVEEKREGFHFSFRGNPGTGKTSVARVLGQIFKAHGLLEKGHLVETDRAGLVGQYVGETSTKTSKIIEEALDGVLFIDEAYALFRGDDNSNDFGREAIDLLIKAMEDHRDRLCVIFAGYKKEMSVFMEANPGLASRVTHFINFEDYSDDELVTIAEGILEQRHYRLAPEGIDALIEKINEQRVDASFGNARAVRNVLSQAIRVKSQKLAGTSFDEEAACVLTPEEFGIIDLKNREWLMEEALKELEGLVGLGALKKQIYELKDYIGYQLQREAQGLKVESIACHMTFRGNPGTGKTTVARILAKIFRSMGILKRGQFIEASREDLVAGYVGKTAEKTKALIRQSLGGILFIDEAYALQGQGDNDFGKEAIDTLIKEMEDHRAHLVVILAGYKEEMADMIHTNPGFESRINFHLDFEDYGDKELLAIYKQCCDEEGYTLSSQAEEAVKGLIVHLLNNKTVHFGNGREMRNIFEQTKLRLATRLKKLGLEALEKEILSRIEGCDVPQKGV